MQQQTPLKTEYNMNSNSTLSSEMADAYGDQATVDAVRLAQKRSASQTDLNGEPPAKRANTVKVVLEDDDDDNNESNTAAQVVPVSRKATSAYTVKQSSKELIDTKFDWKKLDTTDKIKSVIQISDTLSKSGDYLNINPLSAVYTDLFHQVVQCGWHFQYQTPPMVCTTGLRDSDRYPGSWSALLAGSEVSQGLLDRINRKPEVTDFMAFMRNLQRYLNDYLVDHGEQIFLNTAQRQQEENEKILAKNPNAKTTNEYKQVPFVTRGKQDPTFGQLYKTGNYTKEQYAAEVAPSIGSFFVAYEDNAPSLNVKAYTKKVKGSNGENVNTNVPDLLILNEEGAVEQFSPAAPYCQKGKTSWEALLKVSIKWYKNQFRFYQVMRSFRYYVNGASDGDDQGHANEIIYTNANGDMTRVVQ